MASDWAAKLSGASASPERKPRKKDTEFNSREVMDYLQQLQYLPHPRKRDKEGEKYKVYKSLESLTNGQASPRMAPRRSLETVMEATALWICSLRSTGQYTSNAREISSVIYVPEKLVPFYPPFGRTRVGRTKKYKNSGVR